MKLRYPAAVLAFAAVGAMAQPRTDLDTFTNNGEIRSPRVNKDTTRRDYTDGECLSHSAFMASLRELRNTGGTFRGECVRDFPMPGRLPEATSFKYDCDGRRDQAASDRLLAQATQLYRYKQPVVLDPADVLKVCTTSRPVTPAARLTPGTLPPVQAPKTI